MTAPLPDDALGVVCSVDGCLLVATRTGHATIRIRNGTTARVDIQRLRFDLPVCSEHAELMNRGGLLVHLDGRL
jgi:hypothetical protein